MNKKLTLCIIGCGRFSQFFVPLFKAHPYVEKVYVCDVVRERAQDFSKKFEVETVDTFDEALSRSDINAIAIFTQRHLHGSQVIKALNAGKHVYSSVPTGITIEEIAEIAALVRKTGLTYTTGETGFYRSCTVFCREKFMSGEMGDFVYAESQYNHDMRNMWDAYKHSGGDYWKKYVGFPPMYYSTHSVSMILGSMPGQRIESLSALGYKDRFRMDVYNTEGGNLWNNPYSNTAMLARISNGGITRISENRSICWKSPESYISKFNGTNASYEFSVAHHYYAKWKNSENREDHSGVIMTDITEQMIPESVYRLLKENNANGIQAIADVAGFSELSPIQPSSRLPKSFEGMPNRHNGCHHFMVDDFCKAAYHNKLAPTNIWQAARFNIPGIIAHESALKDGETMKVPDLGDPPADWEMLMPDGEYGKK